MKCQVCNDKKALHLVVGNSFYLSGTYVCCTCHETCTDNWHKEKEKVDG